MPIDPQAYTEKNIDFGGVPHWADWRAIHALALLTGRVGQGDRRINASFRLWDVATGQQHLGQSYSSTEHNRRHIANMISDAVYEQMTGARGYFDTA